MSSPIRISFIEKLIVNWALPFDTTAHNIHALFNGQNYQSYAEMWRTKVDKYRRLLEYQQRHNAIPDRVGNLCKKTPCGYTRLVLARLRQS